MALFSELAPFRGSLRLFAGALAAFAFVAATPASAGDKRQEAIELVTDASETTAYFANDTAFEPLWDLADQAKAMVIVPEAVRAGFIFGGSAGDAVMIARNDDGTWTQPTFLTVGSVSFGLQAGGEVSESILLVMTERGMEQLLSTSVKLGADLSIAAGSLGAGAKAQTTDIIAFSRSRGLYGGLSLEGAVLKTRRNWNKAYYNADVSPAEVIFRDDVYNPASAQLQNAVWRLAHKDAPTTLAPAMGDPRYTGAPTPLGSTPVDEAPLDGTRVLEPLEPLDADDLDTNDSEYEDDAVWGAPIGKND